MSLGSQFMTDELVRTPEIYLPGGMCLHFKAGMRPTPWRYPRGCKAELTATSLIFPWREEFAFQMLKTQDPCPSVHHDTQGINFYPSLRRSLPYEITDSCVCVCGGGSSPTAQTLVHVG